MPNRPLRFRRGQGLEITADIYAQGHERIENVELDLDDVIRKRDGAESVPLTRAGGAAIAEPVGLWHRGDELCLENGSRLYSRRTCATSALSSTGAWIDRGPWTRGTLHEIVGVQEAGSIRSALRLETPDGQCALEAWSVASFGVRSRVLGAGIEDVAVVDPNGAQAKGGMTGAAQGVVTWQTTVDQIRAAVWTPGAPALGASFQVLPGVMPGDADKQYDFYADSELSGGFGVWAAINWVDELVVRARRTSDGALSAILTVPTAGLSSTARHGCAVWVEPSPVGPDQYYTWVAASFQAGGAPRYVVTRLIYNVATNTLSVSAAATANTAAISFAARPIAVAASWQAPVTVAHVAFGDSTVVLRNLTVGVGDVSVRSLPSTAVVTGFRGLRSSDGRPHRNVIVLADLTDSLLSSALHLVDPFVEGSGSMAGRTTGEWYGRSWVAQCRTTLGNLVGLFSLVRSGDSLLYADSGRQAPNGAILAQACISRWTLQRSPMPPAQMSDYVVQAMGGYARLYDSQQVCEHDWHALPVFALLGLVGGSLTAGARYTVAVTWRWVDGTGRQHDSEPTIQSIVLGAGQGTIRVGLNVLRWTERRGVRALIWISGPNRTSLHVQAQPFAAIDEITTTVATVNHDFTSVVEDTEALATDAIGGAQASITGFCALAGGRLWGPSSRQRNVAQFSTLPGDGLAARWDIDALVELLEPPTVIRELEGRPVVLGRSRITVLVGDGPDNTGRGDDYATKDVPTPLGGRSQAASTLTPLGLLYDTSRGPRLLDRGLSVQDVGAPVAREYEIEGELVRAAAYDYVRGVTHLLGERSGQVLVFSDRTLRWGRDVRGSAVRDVAVSASGRAALLRASDVLVHVSEASYPTLTGWLFASGGIVPAHAYNPRRLADYVTGDPLVVEVAPAIVPVTGAPGILGSRALRTTGAAGQALRATSTTLGSIASQSLAGAAVVRLASTVTGAVLGKQNGLDAGWNVLHPAASGFRALVANSAGIEAISSVTLASSVLGVWRWLVWVIDLVSGELRFATDLEAGPAVPLPPGTLEAVGVPLRLGDSRLPAAGEPSIVGDLGGVALWRPVAPALLDVHVLAQQLKSAWDSASGIPTTRDTRDGTETARLVYSTGWLRSEDDEGATHLPYRLYQALLAGQYEGDHPLTLRLYADYDDSAPVATYRSSELAVALNRYAGRQYLYRFPCGGEDRTYRAVRLELDDGAVETASLRASRLDLAFASVGGGQAEADEELDVPEVPA